jgi:predicted RNA-binding Zn-ribbon protein involved in translation (DUF1610 family)
MMIRRFSCSSCGAPREAREDAVLLLCESCGAFLAIDSGLFFRGTGLADLRDRQLKDLFDPGRAQARRTVLQGEMASAAARGDRPSWREAAREFHTLLAAGEPWTVPGHGSVSEVRKWLDDTIAFSEFLEFCEEGKAAQAEYAASLSRFGRGGDPVETAREALDKAEAFYRRVSVHSEFPSGILDGVSLGHLARQMLRASVTALESVLGPGAAARIYREVLGDTVLSTGDPLVCGGCGADLEPGTGVSRAIGCPHCGTVIHAEREDPWLLNTLAIWETVTRDLGRDGRVPEDGETAMSALGMAMTPIWMGGKLQPEPIHAFLRRAIPWVRREAVEQAIRILASAVPGDQGNIHFFEGLAVLVRGWKPEGRSPFPLAVS